MFTVITKNLHTPISSISLDEVLHIIEHGNPFISSDYHLLKYINKKHDKEEYEEAVLHTINMIKYHNKYVHKEAYWIFLGDISEKELSDSKDIADLWRYCKELNGSKKVFIKGNNDNFDNNFYLKCGFDYIENTKIFSKNLGLILSHIPYDLEGNNMDPSVINIHGHLHGNGVYRNQNWKNKIDVYHNLNNGILRLQDYIKKYREGFYKGKTVYAPFADDNYI